MPGADPVAEGDGLKVRVTVAVRVRPGTSEAVRVPDPGLGVSDRVGVGEAVAVSGWLGRLGVRE